MKINQILLILFVGSFVTQYFLLPAIIVDNTKNITNSISKAYISIIFGLYIIILFTIIHDLQYKSCSYKHYTVMSSCLLLFIYLYRNQVYVNDSQYLEAIIENNGSVMRMSNEILKKSNDFNVIKLAKNIIQVQKDELIATRALLEPTNS